MSVSNLISYILVAIILFQDSISVIASIGFIDYIDELVVIWLVLIALKNIIIRRKMNRLSFILTQLLILFSFIGIYSTYRNSNFVLRDVIMSNFLSVKFIIIIISLMNIDLKYSTLERYKNSILFYSKVVMFFAVLNFIFPEIYSRIFYFTTLTYRFGLPSICSLFKHTGTYGWFMLFVATYYYSLYMIYKEKKYRKNFIIYACFSILSFRVKVILGLIGIMFFSLFINSKRKINFKHILIVTIIGATVLFVARDLLSYTYLMYFTDTFGQSSRNALTINSFRILKDYFPIGVGFGKFGSWYARIKYSEHYYAYHMTRIYGLNPVDPFFATDTYWPSIIGETGFLGSTIFISILFNIYNKIKKKAIFTTSKYSKALATSGILVFIQTLIESSSEAIFNNSPQYIFIAILLGIAVSVNRIEGVEEERG